MLHIENPETLYSDEQVAKRYNWGGPHVVRDRRCKGLPVPDSFRIGKRRYTKGQAMLDFEDEVIANGGKA